LAIIQYVLKATQDLAPVLMTTYDQLRDTRLIHVAAAAILDSQGRVLISKRHHSAHQGGLWEFPGGKLEPGEAVLAGLARELLEELNIRPLRSEPLIKVTHHYPDRSVLLDVHRVLEFSGKPRGMEGQPLAWRLPSAMHPSDFPAADRPIITALQLPDRYLITGADATRPVEFLQRLEAAIQQGLSMVQLRAHELADADYFRLAAAAWEICQAYGAQLVLSRTGQLQSRADGVHLTRQQLLALTERPQLTGWIGASCHNPQELQQAERLGLDYALLSPVQPTRSHPDAVPLGWERFAQWVAQVNLPVYALGGLSLKHLAQAKRSGAQGIAAIGAFWGAQATPEP
jgi:8-oxo-dGTP diphosphatase